MSSLSDHDRADFSYKSNRHYGIFLLHLVSCLSRLPPHFYPESQHPSLCHLCSPTPSADDGALRIWKNFADQKNPEMVTAWQGLSDMLPTTRGQPPAGVHSKDQRSILLCAFLPSSLRSYSQNNPCSSSPTAPPLHSIPVTLPHTPIQQLGLEFPTSPPFSVFLVNHPVFRPPTCNFAAF